MKESDELNKLLLPFWQTGQGKAVVEQFLLLNQRTYPYYFNEIEGLAAGSGVPLSTLMLLQFADELEAGWIDPSRSKPDCSDIHVRSFNTVLVGHNEDAEPAIKDTAYIVDYEFTDTGEKFVAYTYPGRLPGIAWGFSSEGNLTFSMNWVGAVESPYTVGLARGFINRDIYGSKSVTEAMERATPNGRTFGFTMNIGDMSAGRIYSVEVAPRVYSVWEVGRNYSHFNMYKELNIPMIMDESTIHRQARCNEFPLPAGEQDIRQILGDTKDPIFPIFRVATKSDPEDTVVTVIFDLVKQQANVWSGTNPKLVSSGLVMSMK